MLEPTLLELEAPAERQPGCTGWLRANFGVYVCVDRYARFMGSMGGLLMSVLLLGVWVGLGNSMGYSNPNWWLIIGSYTGLVSHFCNPFSYRRGMPWSGCCTVTHGGVQSPHLGLAQESGLAH